jgi:enoyl-CoA hydratase/carnithine racemase
VSETGESLVRAERTGRLLVVWMCRESKRNAVNRQLADELDAALTPRSRCRLAWSR